MDIPIAPTVAGQIFQAISAIVVAIVTCVLGPVIVKLLQGDKTVAPVRSIKYVIAGAITAVTMFFVLGLLLRTVTPKPSVTITSPPANQQMQVRLATTGSGSFTVSGTSSEVFSASHLRVYVLVHPTDPPAAGWWIQQPSTVERGGQWSTLAWIGSKDFPPHVGDKIDLLVVAADPAQIAGRDKVGDPKDLLPAAQSDIVRASIGETQ